MSDTPKSAPKGHELGYIESWWEPIKRWLDDQLGNTDRRILGPSAGTYADVTVSSHVNKGVVGASAFIDTDHNGSWSDEGKDYGFVIGADGKGAVILEGHGKATLSEEKTKEMVELIHSATKDNILTVEEADEITQKVIQGFSFTDTQLSKK